MTSAKLDRKLSVSQRLGTLGFAAFIGIGSMLAVGWYQNSHVDQALDKAIIAQDAIRNAGVMRLTSVELTLVAMDTIVDREERQVAPERVKAIADFISALNAGKPAAMELAASLGKPEIMATFDTDLAEITKAIQVDLKKMVEEGAPADAYGGIDDTIDGAGERMAVTLGKLYEEAGLALGARVADATVRSRESLQFQIAVGLLAMASLMGMLYFHGNILRRGVFAVRDSMQRILKGDYETAVDAVNRSDEIGDMARSVEMFRTAAVEKRDLERSAATSRSENEAERAASEAARAEEARQVQSAVTALGQGLNRLSEGNLTATIDQPFRNDLETLRQDFNHTVEKLQSVLSSVRDNSSSIQSNGQQMRGAADDLAKRTEQQAASLEETSAALDQITVTVRTATQRAEEASQMVGETRTNAEESGRIVREAVEAMARIENVLVRNRQDHQRDRRDRLPDQPACIECRRRGCACRRSRQGLCRRRSGGSRTGATGGRRCQGHQGPGRSLQQRGRNRRSPGAGNRRGARAHRLGCGAHQRAHDVDRRWPPASNRPDFKKSIRPSASWIR